MNATLPLYAYVYILVRRKVRFPTFLRTQHIQGLRNDIIAIECYSEAEVDFYRELCKDLTYCLACLQIEYTRFSNYSEFLDGGTFANTRSSGSIQDSIDGKTFHDTAVREIYDGSYLST